MPPITSAHIEIAPDVCGGRPHVAGHRIRVQDIVVWHERLGLSPDEIVSQHPGLTLADVYAALAYYHDHLEDTRRHVEEDETLARSVQDQAPSKLLQRIANRDAGGDSVSPR